MKVWIVYDTNAVKGISCIFSTEEQANRFRQLHGLNYVYDTSVEGIEVFDNPDEVQIETECSSCGEYKYMTFNNNGSYDTLPTPKIIWNCDDCKGVRK